MKVEESRFKQAKKKLFQFMPKSVDVVSYSDPCELARDCILEKVIILAKMIFE
jgi:hypothetical protein